MPPLHLSETCSPVKVDAVHLTASASQACPLGWGLRHNDFTRRQRGLASCFLPTNHHHRHVEPSLALLGTGSLDSSTDSQISPLSVYCSSAQGLGGSTVQPASSLGEVGGWHGESALVFAACVRTSQAEDDSRPSLSVFSVPALPALVFRCRHCLTFSVLFCFLSM